jgi:hypothetical protein
MKLGCKKVVVGGGDFAKVISYNMQGGGMRARNKL